MTSSVFASFHTCSMFLVDCCSLKSAASRAGDKKGERSRQWLPAGRRTAALFPARRLKTATYSVIWFRASWPWRPRARSLCEPAVVGTRRSPRRRAAASWARIACMEARGELRCQGLSWGCDCQMWRVTKYVDFVTLVGLFLYIYIYKVAVLDEVFPFFLTFFSLALLLFPFVHSCLHFTLYIHIYFKKQTACLFCLRD